MKNEKIERKSQKSAPTINQAILVIQKQPHNIQQKNKK